MAAALESQQPLSKLSYQIAAVLALLVVGRYLLSFAIAKYRVYLHPLSSFPGPAEAAASTDWEYKIRKQPFNFPEKQFEELHKKHKAHAVRIGPNELHIDDVQLYSTIYNQTTTFYKEPVFYDAFVVPHTLFSELDPSMHKVRRKMLNPLFARTGVYKLEPIINEKLDILERKIKRLSKKQDIDIYRAIRCMTTEVISEFAFARSAGFIEESENSFHCDVLAALDHAGAALNDLQHFAVMRTMAKWMPAFISKKMSKELALLLGIHDYARESIAHWEKTKGTKEHPVVFDNLTTLSETDTASEGVDILIAGTDTTAYTMTYAMVELSGRPDLTKKLLDALNKALAGTPKGQHHSLQALEKVDYLIGVVKESLRLAMPVPGRLPRIVPAAPPFIVDGKVIPPGTIVGMSAYTMHTSEEIWGPDAAEFKPERWCTPESKRLDQYLVTFSKGSRMCIGQNLAQAELTMGIAYLFLNFKISRPASFQTPKPDDFFVSAFHKQDVMLKFEAL